MKITAIYFVYIFIQCISTINGDVDDIPITPEEYFEVKNSMDFTGKVALVTGSSSGIGAATARLFSYLGAKVVVTGRNDTRIHEIANECEQLSPYNYKPLALQLDLTIPGNVAKLFNETITAYGRIDVLANVAGVGNFALLQSPNFNEVLEQLRAIIVDVAVELTRLSAPYIQSSNGSIVFMTSILARNPIASTGAYSMGKNTLMAFANTIVHDLGPSVRVNFISPGIVDGTRIFRLINPNPRPALIANSLVTSALQRPGIPMDIAKTIVYLASPLAGFINSKELQLDGGVYVPLL